LTFFIANTRNTTNQYKIGKIHRAIVGLQSIPGESRDKDTAAMLVEQTIDTNEQSFVEVQPRWPP